MSSRRAIELVLAGLIAGGGLFAVMAPWAAPFDAPGSTTRQYETSWPAIASGDFHNIEVSNGTRAAASEILSRRSRADPFAAPQWTPDNKRRGAEPTLDIAARHTQGSPDANGASIGVRVSASPGAARGEPRWWLIGGTGQTSYSVTPAALREGPSMPVTARSTVGDAHFGVGVQLDERTFVSGGYVRESRRYHLGARGWEEDDHYVGVSIQMRW